MFVFLSYIFICIILFKIYYKYTCGMCLSNMKMLNKVVVVTGANTGIGYETAKDLARRGAKVIIACRDQQKGNNARESIVKETNNTNVFFELLDLASLKSVKQFCDTILKTQDSLHVLINNAGTGKLDNSLTEDNLPIESQVNHFGPFRLTLELLPLLRKSTPSRVINVSSVLHRLGKVDLENFHKQAASSFEHRRVYSNTKLANILFTKKLSQDLQDTGITVNCLHPGSVSSDIFRDQPSFVRFLIRIFFKTPWEGAQTSIHLAVAPELEHVTGKYFVECKEAEAASVTNDSTLAYGLWQLSDKVTILDNK